MFTPGRVTPILHAEVCGSKRSLDGRKLGLCGCQDLVAPKNPRGSQPGGRWARHGFMMDKIWIYDDISRTQIHEVGWSTALQLAEKNSKHQPYHRQQPWLDFKPGCGLKMRTLCIPIENGTYRGFLSFPFKPLANKTAWRFRIGLTFFPPRGWLA